MNIELLTVGTELLLGFTIDTNGAEIGRLLAAHGVRVVRRTSVADDGPAIREATDSALMRTSPACCSTPPMRRCASRWISGYGRPGCTDAHRSCCTPSMAAIRSANTPSWRAWVRVMSAA